MISAKRNQVLLHLSINVRIPNKDEDKIFYLKDVAVRAGQTSEKTKYYKERIDQKKMVIVTNMY